jgi:hypothetical protein
MTMSSRGKPIKFPTGTAQSKRTSTTTIVKEEYIQDIAGNTGVGVITLPVNPGQASTFPWLSIQAAQWEKYRFNSLQFLYKPTVSPYYTNGQEGKIILSADYDASDLAPTTKKQAEDTEPRADCMPYEYTTLTLDCREMHFDSDAKFVRPGIQPPRTDLKTYDCANLNVVAAGNAATTTIGELWAKYSVTFITPVLESATAASKNTTISFFVSGGVGEAITSTVGYQVLFATATNNGVPVVNTAGSFVPPAGNYLIFVNMEFTVTTALSAYAVTLQKDSVNQVSYTGMALSTNEALSFSWFLSLNGTDTVAVDTIATFTGTGVVVGSIIFQYV